MSVHPRNGRWQVRYKNAAGEQKSGGVYDRKGEAEQVDRDIKSARRRGGLAPDARHVTMADLWVDFLELRVANLDESTQAKWHSRWLPKPESVERGRCKLSPWHLGHKWAKWPLGDITFEVILAWHTELRRAGATDATMWSAHDSLSALLNFAWKKGVLDRNPAAQAGRPSYTPERVLPSTIWLPDDIEALRNVLLARARDGRQDFRWNRERDAVLVGVLAYCALRPWDEGLELEWPHVGEKTLTIVDTKTGKPRTVPLLEPVARDLREWRLRCGRPKRGLVFPRTREHVGRSARDVPKVGSGTWSKKVWEPTIEAAGLDYMRPYHLRHSCISMWLAEGTRHSVVAKRAGHSVTVLADTYDHVIEEWEDRTFDMAAEVRRARSQSPDTRRLVAV